MRCPTCKREFDPAASTAKPFCCDRCRLIDLGRWLDEGYALPEVSELEEEAPPRPSDEDDDE